MTAWSGIYGLLNLSWVLSLVQQNAGRLLLGAWDLACQHLRCENLKLDYANTVKQSIKFMSSRLLCSNLILWFVAEKSL